jgi:hypothetical protein
MEHLIDFARNTHKNGRPAAEDPVIRHKMTTCSDGIDIMRCHGDRCASAPCIWRWRCRRR